MTIWSAIGCPFLSASDYATTGLYGVQWIRTRTTPEDTNTNHSTFGIADEKCAQRNKKVAIRNVLHGVVLSNRCMKRWADRN